MINGKYALYRAEREKGLTYQEIADKYGVTKQNVGLACAKYNPFRFQFHTEDSIIYPNLRKWLNDNKVSNAELCRRMELVPTSGNLQLLHTLYKGGDIRKSRIDKLIAITGMTYEKLFATSVEEVKDDEMD